MHEKTPKFLKELGISTAELGALSAKGGPAIPWKPDGFGLYGTTGTGKTWAMVRTAARLMDEILSGPPTMTFSDGLPPPAGFELVELRKRAHEALLWVNWPAMAEDLKSRITASGAENANEKIEHMKTIKYLFLDDIGQERIAKEGDYSVTAFKNVIDFRCRDGKKTFWTTNLAVEKLNAIYGTMVISRILGNWPQIQITGEDRRLKNGLST